MSTDLDAIVAKIRGHHRPRRFAMKQQQRVDRSMEAFIRTNFTDWNPDLDDAGKAKVKARVQKIIKAARTGKQWPDDLEEDDRDTIRDIVGNSDLARAASDEMRGKHEKGMERLAKELPVWRWVDGIKGVGEIGVATIIAEAGNLKNYPSAGHLRKRLYLAPYDGCAGSTWQREGWRPRALTNDEWIANPFNGQRYALIIMIATFLLNHQIESKAKSGTKYGRPTGPYGEIYVRRREQTAVSHPDWSDMHAHRDALRVMMQRFVKDLWEQWRVLESEQ